MSGAYVSAAPIVRVDGDIVVIVFESFGEKSTQVLTRHAALALTSALRRETPLLMAPPDGQIVNFPSKKKRGSDASQRRTDRA